MSTCITDISQSSGKEVALVGFSIHIRLSCLYFDRNF